MWYDHWENSLGCTDDHLALRFHTFLEKTDQERRVPTWVRRRELEAQEVAFPGHGHAVYSA